MIYNLTKYGVLIDSMNFSTYIITMLILKLIILILIIIIK